VLDAWFVRHTWPTARRLGILYLRAAPRSGLSAPPGAGAAIPGQVPRSDEQVAVAAAAWRCAHRWQAARSAAA